MASSGYEPGAQSDEPKQFRGYKVLKLMRDIPGEVQTFLGKKETGDMFSIFITLAKRRKRTGRKIPYKNGLNTL
jgi:hypothetical protein